MKLKIEPIREWFGFTRRERRSSFTLLVIIIIIIVLRYAFPKKNIDIEDLSDTISSFVPTDENSTGVLPSAGEPFSFNPNTASYDTLIRLGLDAKEAKTLISFRTRGGKFRRPADIKKVYGIEEEKAEKLIPFVEVLSDTPIQFRSKSSGKVKSSIDINFCDSAMLVTLPGIGPVLSARIIKYRHLLGGFATTEQLKEVYGLPAETFNLIRGRVFADSSEVKRININAAGYKELARFPYFEKYEVTAILKYRELKGMMKSIEELTDNKLISEEKARKVRPYLRF